MTTTPRPIRFGVINVSDRASAGIYEDVPGQDALAWLEESVATPWEKVYAVVPDDGKTISDLLIDWVDVQGCCLILTTGGTGPSPRDVTPEATEAVCDRMMPGFAEAMRAESLKGVPTAILSRQVAGLRGGCLIINLPGKPRAIRECLGVVAPAIPYCVFLACGLRFTYRDGVVDASPDKPA